MSKNNAYYQSMNNKRIAILFLALSISVSLFSQKEAVPAAEKQKVLDRIADMPLTFRKNIGQWDKEILFQGNSPAWGANVAFLARGVSFGFSRNYKTEDKEAIKFHHGPAMHEYLVWNQIFKNANKEVKISANDESDSHVNYLIGNDPSKHQTNVPDYKSVKYINVYENIDITYYGKGNNLEYDFNLNPGADISQIQITCEGVEKLEINNKGQLSIVTQWGTLLEEIPESYQYINGEKKIVKIKYRLIDKTTFGFFAEENYDNTFALVIDPINYAWGTFVGGGAGADGYISDIAVDNAGNVYGTGWYNGVYPTTAGSYQPNYKGGGGYGDAYIFKLNPTATAFVYATYIGGAVSYEQGEGIEVNAAGEVYVCGWTQSTDFPTTPGAYHTTFTGTSYQDIWITKLNAAGSALIYSNLIGGIYSDYAYAIALEPSGAVYITGYSTNNNLDFPTTGGAYQSNATGAGVYVLKMNPAGSALVYSTFTANSGIGYGIAIDGGGNAYLTGTLYGNMTTTAGAFQPVANPNIGIYPDMFVQKINPAGSNLVYSTYLGGNQTDDLNYGDAIAVDAAGNAFITGGTASPNFPVTPGAYDVTQSGGMDPFLAKLNSTGTALIYATFLASDGIGCSVAINNAGEAFVTGNINSQGFTATTCANFSTWGGGTDCFLAKIDAAGANAQYLSYFGGNGNDYGNGPFGKVRVRLWGPCLDEVYVSTTSHSANFPTTPGTVQSVKANSGADQPVVFHLKPKVTPNFTYTVNCNVVNFTDLSNGTCIWQAGPWLPTAWQWHFGDGTSSTAQNPSHAYSAAGTYTVTLIISCPRDSIKIPVTVSPGIVLSTTVTPSGCSGSTGVATTTVTSGTGPFTYTWSPSGGNAATANNLPPGHYTVTVSNGSCTNKDTVTILSSGTTPVTGAITGPTPVCPNATGTTYSVTNTVGSTYNWSVTGTGTITAGQGTNSTTINWGATGGVITCTETNGCGSGTPVTFTVVTNATPVTSAISGTTTVCANSTNVTYSVTNTAGSTYNWSVTGSGTVTAGQGTNVITVSWGAIGGTISCTETASCGTGTPVTLNVTVTTPPVSSAINGPTPLCPNATNTTYSVTNHAGSTYNWSVPGTATITAGQNTNSINVNWASAGGVITCTETNSCGSGTPVTFTVVMGSIPVTGAINGPTPLCPNATGTTYSVTNTAGSTYNWSVPGTATITAGQNTNSITVNWAATGGVISVTATNSCGSGTAQTFTVVISGTPVTGPINGPTPLCPNATGTYSVTNTVGSTYNWSVPGTATVTAGQGTNSINVSWGATGGVISCTETASCGTATPVTYTVVMNSLPATGAISGTTPVCPNATNVVYTVNSTVGSTYNWTVPAGATIVSGQGTNSILVNWGSTPGNITVTETNACGAGTAVIYPVTMLPLPSTSPISGGNPSCANTNGITYSVTPTVGSTYNWSVPGTATITAGQGTSSITLNWGTSGGVITCTESNSCGPGTPVTYTVTFSNLPVTSTITGVSPVCPNQNGTVYTVTNNTGSTYNWTVTGGGTVASGQNTSTLTVNWGASGGVVTCTESNICGNGAPVSFTVAMGSIPVTGVITGPTPVCANATNTTYSVSGTTGSTYNWTVPAGATISSGQGTNAITINWGTTGGTISVTETNACGNGTAIYPVIVDPAPTISITATPKQGCVPLFVSFTDLSTVGGGSTITGWNWLFGDGNTSTLQNPVNVYLNSGAFSVTLTLTTNAGCTSTLSAVNYINVYPNPHA
ncbi:MAG TPA: PKD domain-containing protein, partial [Bacteroidia bacterium]|nr:PKD domain-containing protein [Bacteroidia bacterium]